MTPKQALFVQEYLVDLNGTQAAIRAGYAPKAAQEMASENLSKPIIAAAIKEALDKRKQKVEVEADWVLLNLKDEACRLDDLGSASARVRSLELLGKHIGMFSDKLIIGGELRTTTGPDLSPLNDDELAKVDDILTAALARTEKPAT